MADISIVGVNKQGCVENTQFQGRQNLSQYSFDLSDQPNPQWSQDFNQAISLSSVLTNMNAHITVSGKVLSIYVPKGSNPQPAVDEVKKAIGEANHSTSDFQQRVNNIKV